MQKEWLKFDRKSLKTVVGKTADFNEIAKDSVAFSNARGGELHIGIEDGEELPPADQTIPESLPTDVIHRLNQLTINVYLQSRKEKADNGGEYFILTVAQQQTAIASTTKGQYFIRIGDESRPVLPDELMRLIADKSAFCWETKVSEPIHFSKCDKQKLSVFLSDIRSSDRVSQFVKSMPDQELLLHYFLVDEQGMMTNLGILWIGTQPQRGRLMYSPSVQYIKYDHRGQKVSKMLWDDYRFNPKELIEALWQNIPDWKEFTEISDGMFRREIPAYDEKVVREILCNALVHRPYTTRGDIFINVHADRMEVVNPGLFPIGVTASNILQKTQQRNEHLAKIFFDLHLMEKEGSGYDLIYETLLSAGKDTPQPFEGDDFVKVTIFRNIISQRSIRLIENIRRSHPLTQRNLIALGLIVKAGTIRRSELSQQLQLPTEERVRDYILPLLENDIISQSGRGRGVRFTISRKAIDTFGIETDALEITHHTGEEIQQKINAELEKKQQEELQAKLSEKSQNADNPHDSNPISVEKSTQKIEENSEENEKGTLKSTLKDEESTLKSTLKTRDKVLAMIAENPQITREEIAVKLGLSLEAIKKHFSILKSQGLIRRVGPNKGGHWEVITEE